MAGQQDAVERPVLEDAILLDAVGIDVSDTDRTILVETICGLVAGAPHWNQPAIAVWTSRSQGRSSIPRQLYHRLDPVIRLECH